MMEIYNYFTYCESCGKPNKIEIPIEFKLKPIDYLESTEINCERCNERILI